MRRYVDPMDAGTVFFFYYSMQQQPPGFKNAMQFNVAQQVARC
jgi:hypothetical protein